jgi:phage tail sheath gpL-like
LSDGRHLSRRGATSKAPAGGNSCDHRLRAGLPEHRDYLASLHVRAFDFIYQPYRKTDLERILQAALSERAHAARLRVAMMDTVSVLETRAGLR